MKSIFTFLLILFLCPSLFSQEYSLRFLASGGSAPAQQNIDRVKIPIDNPHRPVDVGFDFTVEFWMKANPNDNNAGTCSPSSWYYGNVIIDRDVFNEGDYGDYGIVICNRRIVAGVERLNNTSQGVVGQTIVDDGQWHHIAVTRNAQSGAIRLYVDGNLDASIGSSNATGDISYRNGRSTDYPSSDPYLVFGAEKHDYMGSLYYKGWLDEVRISNIIRYTSNFTRPSSPFATDANTVGLYHFNEGAGNVLTDVSGATGGPSDGQIVFGGNPQGPVWSADSPFFDPLLVVNTNDSGPGSFREVLMNSPSGSTITFSALLMNQTILMSSGIQIDKNINFVNINSEPVNITVTGSGPVFDIQSGKNVSFQNLNIIGGTGGSGRAILNHGTLALNNVKISDSYNNPGNSIENHGVMIINGTTIIDKD
ncbi:MAG: LamG domain-containing protein [Saprospiraceae bacterium]|nr:LamG domain-containing protein [Saprospiraceae bacterium]